MPWIRLAPSLSSAGLVYSSGVSCSLVPYVTSHFCVVRAVIWVVGGVRIWWATWICIHSWICGRFPWSVVQYNSVQDRSLQIYSLPSWMLSCSAAPGFWGDVVRAASQNIRCRNHKLSRKIGWGTIYGARDQVLCLPHSSPPSWVAYTENH